MAGGAERAALAELFETARRVAVDTGRDPDVIEFCTSPPHGMARIEKEVAELRELGAGRIILAGFQFFTGNPQEALMNAMERLPG